MLRLLVGVLAAAVMACGEVPTADALIKQIQAHYNSAQTLSVDFVQNYSLLGHNRPAEAGTLTLRKGGKMRWDYTHPQGKLFISDGKSVFLYTASDNRVEKVPLRNTEDMRAPLAFLLGKLDMKREFRDFAVRENGEGVWLTASAKNDRVLYRSVDMLVGPGGSIRKLTVAGRDESLLSYTLTDEKLNIPVNDSSFHFVTPPGAEVVDAIQIQSGDQK